MSAVQTARDLRPGDAVILSWGAYYGTGRALVLGHHETRWGHHAELVVERFDEEGEPHYVRDCISGTPTALGIGWQPAGNE